TRVNVAEDRARARVDHGLRRREERVGGDDHLVAGTDAEAPQGDRQSVGAAGHAHAVAAAYVRRELGLESLNLGAEYVAARSEHRPLAVGHLRYQWLESGPGREQRDGSSFARSHRITASARAGPDPEPLEPRVPGSP